ncbi:helix-turn-helix transcriptional regulator [Candidatus Schmidhempelia bombi]|uniref:Bacteriophage CI repressor n=1 Tax=Candidatus Schmidhempelia bombi str. Bimp TaxID=1387197 RepID=A0AB94IE03_9GAMM|nr:helix-turn-helix transcriptional regulator [Candidatus Schmidhempelia bombi]TEA27695.1 bacteriophage CI repressor [Candidatus Schmidhempelia bombi str. Bimp]
MVQFDSAKNIIDRMVSAYRLKTMKALCEYFGVGISVLSNRVVRNTTPAEYIIQCALDTGANLLWLCTGEGEPNIDGIKTEKKSIELSSDALEKLERIAALKNNGAITDDEYQLLKGSIFKNQI